MSATMADLDSGVGASQHHHQQLLLLDRRGKRQRMEEPSKALARALLETVRQALDDDTDDDDAEADFLTTAAQRAGGQHHPVGRRAPRIGSGFPPVADSPLRGLGMLDQQQYPDPDQDPVAYVRVDGGHRHHDSFAGAKQRGHSRKPPLPPGPVAAAEDLSLHAARAYGPKAAAWMHDPAALTAFPPGTLAEQHEALAAAAAHHHQHPYHAETPSHGSTHTNVEAGDAWERDLGDGRGAAGGGAVAVAGGAGGDFAEYGVVDRPEQTSTDDGNDGHVQRSRKHATSKAGIPGGPCAHCGATESPQWRRPLTKKVVLCNACGIYFSRHHSLPKRKKLAGGSSQVIQRSSKGAAAAAAAHPPPAKQVPLLVAPSIMCEEELEMEEEDGMVGPAAYGADVGQGAAAPYPGGARAAMVLPGGSVRWGLQAAPMDGLAVKAPQPVRERVALSLPLMTAFPVVGGINTVVQTFLKPDLAIG